MVQEMTSPLAGRRCSEDSMACPAVFSAKTRRETSWPTTVLETKGPRGLRTNSRVGDAGSGGEASLRPQAEDRAISSNNSSLWGLLLKEGWFNCKASTP